MSSPSYLAEPQLNATPLIDVLLVLLIMLIFTLPIATQMTKVNLPQRGPSPPASTIRLEIMYRGDIYWDGTYVASLTDLTPKLVELANRADPPLLMVAPERLAPYERVAQVLAAAQRSKVQKMSVTPVPE